MPEPTNTLQTLRRDLCNELRMPFFRRFQSSSTVTGGTTSAVVDTALTQDDDFWSEHWFYHVDSGETRLIKDFLSDVDTCILERALTSVSVGDEYEIQSIWNAEEIKHAINRAIKSASRIFIDTVTDETLIMEEDQLEYDLSALSSTPFFISKILIESNTNSRQGAVESATSTTITDTGAFSGMTSGWKVSIFYGTGSGQIRDVSSYTDDELTVSAWDTTPDSSSKYLIWNPSEQLDSWIPLTGYSLDSVEYPSKLYLQDLYASRYGLRFRIEYLSIPGALSSDSDTTLVPYEYIINKAASLLHSQMSGDQRYDREFHYSESLRFDEMAQTYLTRNLPATPTQVIPTEREPGRVYYRNEDPMGWGRQ